MSLLVTRDCQRFRKLKSPIGTLADHLFSLLASSGDEGVRLRDSYAHCISGEATNEPGSFDRELKDYFSSPPSIALIQGPFRPDFLLEARTPPDSPAQSINSTYSGVAAPELADVILLPFVLHQTLLEAAEQVDEADSHLPTVTTLKQVCLSAIAHETAHWLWNKRGYVPDPRRRRIAGVTKNGLCATQRPDDDLILISLEPSDAGCIAWTQLFGWFYKHITMADGVTEVVKRRPEGIAIPKQPAMSQVTLTRLLGGSLPNLRDLSGWPHALNGQAPKWLKDQTYLVTGQISPNSMCQHGNCRLGERDSS